MRGRSVADVLLLDTNVLLRHLLQDTAGQSAAATGLLKRIEAGEFAAKMTAMAIAEMVWVLSGAHYGFSRDEIRQAIGKVLLIPGIQIADSEAIRAALDIYAAHNADFIDAYHSAFAGSSGMAIVSFDRDFDRIPGTSRIEPAG